MINRVCAALFLATLLAGCDGPPAGYDCKLIEPHTVSSESIVIRENLFTKADAAGYRVIHIGILNGSDNFIYGVDFISDGVVLRYEYSPHIPPHSMLSPEDRHGFLNFYGLTEREEKRNGECLDNKQLYKFYLLGRAAGPVMRH